MMQYAALKAFFMAISLSVIVACSNFSLAGIENGNPPPPEVVVDTLVDTLIVPNDSIIQKIRYAILDTIFDSSMSVRKGNYIQLKIDLNVSGPVDSLEIYGLTLTNGIVSITAKKTGAFLPLDSLEWIRAGDQDRYQYVVRSGQHRTVSLQWVNHEESDLQLTTQILVGCTSIDSTTQLQTSLALTEYRDISLRSSQMIGAGSALWIPVPVIAGDSISGRVQLDTGLSVHLLSSNEFEQWLISGNLGDELWSSQHMTDTMQIAVNSADTLYWTYINSDSIARQLSDSVVLSH